MKLKLFLFLSCIFFFSFSFQSNAQAKKKVVMEFFTSSSCGNCPTGIGEINRLLDVYDEDCIIWISHHAGWLWDPMVFGEITTIASESTSGAPTAMIDRTNANGSTYLATTPSFWEDQLVDHLALPARAGFSFSGGYTAENRTLDFSVDTKFESAVEPGDIRLNVMILEDKVHEGPSSYNQANYNSNTAGHPFEGAGNPIIGYEHRNVTRAVLDAAWGTENLIPDIPVLNQEYTASYSYTLPDNLDETQISIVAFLSYYDADVNKRQVINGDVIHIDDLTTTGVNDISFIDKAVVAPNPANSSTTLTINAQKEKVVQVQLSNFQGQLVRKFESTLLTGENAISFDLNGLPTGTYLLMITDGKENLTRRVIVGK